MVSQIDETKPEDGSVVPKSDLRANFGFAKSEIEALQAEIVALLAAVGTTSGVPTIPDLGGDNTPTGAQNLPTILLALDAAITAAAASGGGGATELGDLTDILSPSEAIRAAFQQAISGVTQNSDFNFDEGSQVGRFITLDTASNSVTMTLPEPESLTASDGLLCVLVPTSGQNFAAITGPSGDLRFQTQIFGAIPNQTTVFIGQSRGAGFSSIMRVYKDGPVYRLEGPGRLTETDDLRFNAPGTVLGSALAALSLEAASFPNLLNLGGSKQAGGNRGVVTTVTGNRTLAQADSGTILVHTGAGAATWTVPDLADGTTIEIENQGGQITLDTSGASNTIVGSTGVAPDASAAVRYVNGVTKLIGTS